MILDIPPHTAQLIINKAQQQGITVNELLQSFVADKPQLAPRTPGRLAHLNIQLDEKELLSPIDDWESTTDKYGLSIGQQHDNRNPTTH